MSTKNHILISIVPCARILISACVILGFSTATLWAESSESDLVFFETKVVEGLSIGVAAPGGDTNIPPEQPLVWTVFTTGSNAVPIRFSTEVDNQYQVELVDSQGNLVPKTQLGARVGVDFLDYRPERLKEGSGTQLVYARRKETQLLLLSLFRPKDYFVIEKSGHYLLRIRFQIMAYAGTGKQRNARFIRFPALEVPLVKSALGAKKDSSLGPSKK